MLDGGAHFYRTYETSDGKYISLAPIEPEFYREMIALLGIDSAAMPPRMDRAGWPAWKEKLEAVFRQKTRDEWCELFEGSDACFAPVMTMQEAPGHPQNRARGVFVEHSGIVQPAPTPRFERTPGEIQRSPPKPGEHTIEALSDWGFESDEINALLGNGCVSDHGSESDE
jgi:alpha-methylacyl-CoA racemase